VTGTAAEEAKSGTEANVPVPVEGEGCVTGRCKAVRRCAMTEALLPGTCLETVGRASIARGGRESMPPSGGLVLDKLVSLPLTLARLRQAYLGPDKLRSPPLSLSGSRAKVPIPHSRVRTTPRLINSLARPQVKALLE
jgi:hypothetical protein